MGAYDRMAGAVPPAAEPLRTPKAWRTAQARATLAGFQSVVIEADNGRPLLVVNRQALTCSFADLQDLEDWLSRVEPSRS